MVVKYFLKRFRNQFPVPKGFNIKDSLRYNDTVPFAISMLSSDVELLNDEFDCHYECEPYNISDIISLILYAAYSMSRCLD